MSGVIELIKLIVVHGNECLLTIATAEQYVRMMASVIHAMSSHTAAIELLALHPNIIERLMLQRIIIEQSVLQKNTPLAVVARNYVITQIQKARNLLVVCLRIIEVTEIRYPTMRDRQSGLLPESNYPPPSDAQRELLVSGTTLGIGFAERMTTGIEAIEQRLRLLR